MKQLVSYDRTDEQLVSSVRAGDGRALQALFDRQAPSLHALAFRLLGSVDDADDVVQDVFVGLSTALARYHDDGKLGAWLRQVTVRAALMRLRSDRRRDAAARAATGPGVPVVQPDAEPDHVLAGALSGAIDALPASLRTVFVLRMIEGYSHEEIGRSLGLSVAACKVRLHRALRRLRPQLKHLREDLGA